MSHDGASNGLSRRDLIKTGALAAGAAAVLPARPAAAQLKTVPRNRTLSLVWIGSREGRWVDYELWNPYAIGANHQNGPGILYEPLAYYSAFADKEHLWLAESYRYSAGLQGADDQDPLRDQVERRRAVLGRGRRLHAEQPAGPGPEGAVGRRRPAVHAGGPGDRRQHGRDQVQGARRRASSSS